MAKITLKNFKHAEFASHETNCFEATVYLDGKKFGNVENDGHGGCSFFWPIDREADATGRV